MVSINTNVGAFSAQQNLNAASNLSTASISRLSSGNRIDKAATDVAGLSVGTILATNVSTLRKGLDNAGQASTLLQVADGGLKNLSDILQRQKALAVQATSGTLSATERGYLNQEFQNLTSEIDRLVDNTKFNSVKLLDGTIQAGKGQSVNNDDGGSTSAASTTAIITLANAAPASGDKISIAGVTVEFTSSATGTTGAVGKVLNGANVTEAAANLVRFLNESKDARLAPYNFTSTGGAISANWTGGTTAAGIVVDAATVSVTTAANFTVATSANRTIAVTNMDNRLRVDRTAAIGPISGSVLVQPVSGSSALAIDTRTIEDNKDFNGVVGAGTIGKFVGVYNGATDAVNFSIQVGDITYRSNVADIATGATVAATFTGYTAAGLAKGGTFTLNFASRVNSSVDSQVVVDSITNQLNDAFSQVTFTQNKTITSFTNGGSVKVGGAEIANLTGATANFSGTNFENLSIEDIRITAPAVGNTDAVVEVTINGEVYRSFSGIGSKIDTNTVLALQNTVDPTKALTIVTGNTTAAAGSGNNAILLDTQDRANAVADALKTAFGVGGGVGKLKFQIGSTSADAIAVAVKNVDSSTIFGGLSLDVTTLDNANIASAQLDKAIQYVTAVRADVGGLQSRFDYAAANLETSIQNVDAARGKFLDTDVSAESTAFAQAQVKLQASISVLAQANQLPQNLLKLLG